MKLQAKKEEVMAQENAHLTGRPNINPPRTGSSAPGRRAGQSGDFLERQRQKQEERAQKLEARRRELRRQQYDGTPRLNDSSLEIARHMAGAGRTSSFERLTRERSPRALEKMEQKKREIEKKQHVEPFKMGERSRDIVVQKFGAASTATMDRLTQPTKSYGKKKLRSGDTKEVVVYRGWSRHVERVPVDDTGRVSISPRLQNTRYYSGMYARR